MARVSDVAAFSPDRYEETVREMAARREKVADKGERVYRETGQLDPLVNIFGATRVSRNALLPEGDKFRLVHGPKLPILLATDGTGSMGENVEKAFYAMKSMNAMLQGVRDRYQTDHSFAVMQDVGDSHPVFQMAQFESDERMAEHVRLLIPDHNGGDATEDYDIGLCFVRNWVETDIVRYGLKGYFSIVADQIGRGEVYPDDVKRHLGHEIQAAISTRALCRELLKSWHLFYCRVAGNDIYSDRTARWWTERLGPGRVIMVPNPDLLAEVQAGLVYVTETANPTQSGLTEFLLAGGSNSRISQRDTREVWSWLAVAEQHFGAQAKLPGFIDIPKPGDLFSHYRHAWPIDHPRASENVTPGETPTLTPTSKTADKPKKGKEAIKAGGIDWGKL